LIIVYSVLYVILNHYFE